MAKKIIESKQRYLVEIVHYTNGESILYRKNDGFSVMEMIGISTLVQQDMIKLITATVNEKLPTTVNRVSTNSPVVHKRKK